MIFHPWFWFVCRVLYIAALFWIWHFLLMQIHLFQFLPPLCSVMSLCGAPGLWHHVLLHCIMKGCDSPLSGTATWQCLSCNGVRVIKLTMSVIIRWLVVQVTLNLPGLNMQECWQSHFSTLCWSNYSFLLLITFLNTIAYLYVSY